MKTTPRLFALLFLLPLLTGCAALGRPQVHEAALVSTADVYELTPDHLRATPLLAEEITGAKFDVDGRLIGADSITRSYGIPPAPRSMYFAASETMADSTATLSQNANWAGIGVTSDRTQTGNAETAQIGADAFVRAAEIQGTIAGEIAKGAVAGAVETVLGAQATERHEVSVKGDVRKAEIAAQPRHEEPAAEPAPVTP